MTGASEIVTAAMVVIGNEILSGRTQDVNVAHFAKTLGARGIELREVRIVGDVPDAIVSAVNALRKTYSLVFTTGGIGPTHDDITADCIAAAFGVGIGEDPDALAILRAYYGGEPNPARRRMARIPHGAELIENPVSGAPGFRLENVYVMAGVPRINQVMLDAVIGRLPGGAPRAQSVVSGAVAEGKIADSLRHIAERFVSVEIGSYPHYGQGHYGTAVVLKSHDRNMLAAAKDEVVRLMRAEGVEPQDHEPLDKQAAGEPGV